MKIWKFTQRNMTNGNLDAIHYVMRPEPSEEGFYNEVRAYNSFNSELRIDECRKRMYRYKDEEDTYISRLDKNHHQIRHLSIYDFFHYIGYDNKKKRF